MYSWLGFNARRIILETLEEALSDNKIEVELFAYDFNDPLIASLCLDLARKGRIRIILDNAPLHTGKKRNGKIPKEDQFESIFRSNVKAGGDIFRCKFGRFAHCKEIILKKNGIPYKVLTGSTNFSYTGLYVNANHILVFQDPAVAEYYSSVFNFCWGKGDAPSFRSEPFAGAGKLFPANGIPSTEVNVSPHEKEYATKLINSITDQVLDNSTKSVLFSVMEMGTRSTGTLIKALREIHKDDSIFTYGITDNSSGEISLYKPGKKEGLLIDAKKANRELPPPFKEEFNLGLAHAIHHKFVVTNFNKENGRVYCGSSNLALGGEEENCDNLICIKDIDVATVFAIEAFRLTDHYNFRSVKDKPAGAKPDDNKKPVTLDNTGQWVNKFYDSNDIRFVERNLLA
jgi:hypothetical protein